MGLRHEREIYLKRTPPVSLIGPAWGAAAGKEVVKMQKTINFQDAFLSAARREKMNVTVFLMNGFQMKGVVRGFDSFVVMLDTDGKQQMIYKHAISTVVPPRPVDMSAEQG